MKRNIAMIATAAAVLVAAPAAAQQVYSAANGTAGNQPWQGTLGLDFTVNSPVLVSSIGVFDDGSNGLSSTLNATIFNAAGTALFMPVSFASGTTSSGQAYIFQSITPLFLAPGTYQVAAWGYNSSEQNYNFGFVPPNFGGNGGAITFNSLGGRLTAIGTRYATTAGGPGTIVDNGTTRYGAGSFLATAIPEPATWAMMLLGFGMVGAGLRSRRGGKVNARVAFG